jgi:hypothetical protein
VAHGKRAYCKVARSVKTWWAFSLMKVCAHRPVPWGEFRLQRYAGDYADLGEEIQVDHYRLPAPGLSAAASA